MISLRNEKLNTGVLQITLSSQQLFNIMNTNSVDETNMLSKRNLITE